MNTRPGLWTVLRDVASWVGGWALIFKEAGILFGPPSQVSETLVWVGAALVGVPGLAQLLALRFGPGTSTGGQQPPSPSPESPPSPSGASPAGADR